ncbi:hypothetical protein BU197_22680 [Streptomyces sp. CBMA291]|nr:hypothetical protein [Streptomyces sp. CBMA291]MBD0714406.1 hypothetical protein [Streptomyces sp. CBMA370]
MALLTALALFCGALAAVLALAVPAKAVTVHGTFTLKGGSGSATTKPFATGVTTPAACPAPADPAKPYVKALLAAVSPDNAEQIVNLAVTTAGDPLSGGPFTRSFDTAADYGTLQDRLAELRGGGPVDGRYELRLYCRTAHGAETADYFSAMIEVTGTSWAPIAQMTTVTEVVSEPAAPTAGGQAKLTATVQPRDAAGTVTFQKFVNEELIDIATVPVAAGKAETTLTGLTVTGDEGLPILATFTPTAPEAHTGSFFVFTLYVTEAGPEPTGTTPTGTTAPTPTGTATTAPTGGPTDTPTDPTDEPTDEPTDTPEPTGTDGPTPTPTATGDSATSGDTTGGSASGSGSSGSDTGSGSSGSSGDGGSTSGGSGTHGGSGSLAATGATVTSAALGSLALVLLGAAAVVQTRRRKGGARP